MKTCIACKHFTFDPSYRYSEFTAGEASIKCGKHHFNDDVEMETIIALCRAETCADYALSDLAKSKGWTE